MPDCFGRSYFSYFFLQAALQEAGAYRLAVSVLGASELIADSEPFCALGPGFDGAYGKVFNFPGEKFGGFAGFAGWPGGL